MEGYFVWVKPSGEIVFGKDVPQELRKRFLRDHEEYERKRQEERYEKGVL